MSVEGCDEALTY